MCEKDYHQQGGIAKHYDPVLLHTMDAQQADLPRLPLFLQQSRRAPRALRPPGPLPFRSGTRQYHVLLEPCFIAARRVCVQGGVPYATAIGQSLVYCAMLTDLHQCREQQMQSATVLFSMHLVTFFSPGPSALYTVCIHFLDSRLPLHAHSTCAPLSLLLFHMTMPDAGTVQASIND